MKAEQVLKETEEKMKKTVAVAGGEFATVRTGRASPALVEGIKVDCYGTVMPLKQLANIGTPEARLIVIQPWDASQLGAIEKAIQQSGGGLTPNNDGRMIRIEVPPLTEERRKELVKLVKRMAEDGRVAIRSIRRDANEVMKKMKNDGAISEDDFFKYKENDQKITDKYTKEIDKLLEAKEKEILEF